MKIGRDDLTLVYGLIVLPLVIAGWHGQLVVRAP